MLGYFLGKKWQLLQAWLGPTALYATMAAIALIFLGIVFRKALLHMSHAFHRASQMTGIFGRACDWRESDALLTRPD